MAGDKQLNVLNLVRMGIAVATGPMVLTRPVYKSNWQLRQDAELQAYLYEVFDMLENRVHGPYQAFARIFGTEAANRMANLGECIAQPSVVETPYLRLTNAYSDTERSISPGASIFGDEERGNVEDEVEGIDPQEGDAEAIIRSPELDHYEPRMAADEEDKIFAFDGGLGDDNRCAMFVWSNGAG
jgi:hypothetical protein